MVVMIWSADIRHQGFISLHLPDAILLDCWPQMTVHLFGMVQPRVSDLGYQSHRADWSFCHLAYL